MIRGPEGDEFRAEWLLLALPALFARRAPTGRSATVGIAVEGATLQVQVAPSGVDVGMPDGREFDAVVTAEAPLVLGLAAGALVLDDVSEIIEIDGDREAVRAIFDA